MKKIFSVLLMINPFIGAFAFAPQEGNCNFMLSSPQPYTTTPVKIKLEKTSFK